MAKPATAPNKSPRCKAAPKPTLDDYRTWYHQERQRAADLRIELDKAKATIDAQATVLSHKLKYPHISDADIPF